MHELSLAENMRELIEQEAQAQAFSAVKEVTLEVGALSHVSEDAMRFCFESAMLGSCAEKATLTIISSEGKGKCPHCGHESMIEHLYDACEQCGGFGLSVISGDLVRIRALAVC